MSLQDNNDQKWELQEHSKVKHELLIKYLNSFLKITGRSWKEITIIDCFAGKGEYNSGESGSPLHILNVCESVLNKVQSLEKIKCIFIEKNKGNFRHLELNVNKKIKEIKIEPNQEIETKLYNKSFEEAYIDIENNEFSRLASFPSFFFIDPFGYSGVPFNLIKNIFSYYDPNQHKYGRPEIFLNLMVNPINRFKTNEHFEDLLQKLFGTSTWKSDIDKLEKIYTDLQNQEIISNYYRKCIVEKTNANFTQKYVFRSSKNNIRLYDMIHATTQFKGLKVMKDIMFRQGIPGSFEFHGKKEKKLQIKEKNTLNKYLGIDDNESSLKKWLIDVLRPDEYYSYDDLIQDIYQKTPFIDSIFKKTVKKMEKSKIAEIIRRTSKRRSGFQGKDKFKIKNK
ncbi:MAG: three-Cys-motif partner protein TcmP [Promethearchaeota archaeon]